MCFDVFFYILFRIEPKNTRNDTKTKTPGLGDAPVIGNLFKSKNKTDEIKELLIFIAPRVIE